MKRFEEQVAVVTGGARGIGLGIARRLGEEGAHVMLWDLDGTTLEQGRRELEQAGVSAESALVDVTDPDQVTAAVQRVVDAHGRLDVLVNGAGITGKTGIRTHEVELDDFRRVMELNVYGVFNGCKAVLPVMQRQGYGRIVNMASISGKEGNAGMLAYSTSKASVIGLTKVVGKEYAEENITCNAVAPAVIRTSLLDTVPEEQVRYMTDKIPMRRTGTIEEIAALVAYVASPEAAFCTGFTFDATGGRATY